MQEDPCKFQLVVKGDQKFLFKAPTSEERDQWVDSFINVVNNLNKIKDSDTFSRASLRSSNRRNAVTITRSSSLSPTPVVVNNSQSPHNSPRNSPKNSPRNSPIHFLDSPALLSRSDSVPTNPVHKGSPILSRQSRISPRDSPTKELENNDAYFTPLQRTTSSLSTNSYTSTISHNSSTSQNPPTASPSLTRSKSAAVQANKPIDDQETSEGTTVNQKVANSISILLINQYIISPTI